MRPVVVVAVGTPALLTAWLPSSSQVAAVAAVGAASTMVRRTTVAMAAMSWEMDPAVMELVPTGVEQTEQPYLWPARLRAVMAVLMWERPGLAETEAVGFRRPVPMARREP